MKRMKIPRLKQIEKYIKMMRLNILETEDIGVFTIGESPMNHLLLAAEREHSKGIKPLVSKKRTKKGTENGTEKAASNKTQQMEAYAAYLAVYANYHHQFGKLTRTNDGCRADLKFIGNDEELYMGIQVKTCSRLNTNERHNCWMFKHFDKDYYGLLMLCRCLEDGAMWLFPYDEVRKHYKATSLSIPYSGDGNHISWDDYRITNIKDLPAKINEYYQAALEQDSCLKLQTHEEIMFPVCENQRKEYLYRARIIPILKAAGFPIYFPFIGDLPYDIILGNLKVQEKIAIARPGGIGLTVPISHSIGGRKKGAYCSGDFDLLLIHLPTPYGNFFYLIPACFLLHHGVFYSEDKDGVFTLALRPDDGKNLKSEKLINNNWSLPFLINREDPNMYKRIQHIHKMQLNNTVVPIVLENPTFWDFECETIHDVVNKWNIPLIFPKSDDFHHFEIFGKKVLHARGKPTQYGTMIVPFNFKRGDEKEYTLDMIDHVYITLSGSYKQYCYIVPVRDMIRILSLEDELPKSISFPLPGNTHGRNSWMCKHLLDFTKDEEFRDILLEFE